MNVQKFLDTLPDQFIDWRKESVRPANESELRSLEGVWVLGNSNTVTLIRHAVSILEPDELYLEMGVLQGGTLVSALHGNTSLAWAVDIWSDFNENARDNKEIFREHVANWNLDDRFELFEIDSESFLRNPPLGRVGVLFYDADHSYRATLRCLLLAPRVLSDNALVVVDDYIFKSVRRAVYDVVRRYDCYHLSMVLSGDTQDSWWNHVALLEYRR